MENVDLDSSLWPSKYIELFADASNDLGLWIGEMMKKLNCDDDSDITLDKFKKPNKDVLVKQLFDAFHGSVHYKTNNLSAM